MLVNSAHLHHVQRDGTVSHFNLRIVHQPTRIITSESHDCGTTGWMPRPRAMVTEARACHDLRAPRSDPSGSGPPRPRPSKTKSIALNGLHMVVEASTRSVQERMRLGSVAEFAESVAGYMQGHIGDGQSRHASHKTSSGMKSSLSSVK